MAGAVAAFLGASGHVPMDPPHLDLWDRHSVSLALGPGGPAEELCSHRLWNSPPLVFSFIPPHCPLATLLDLASPASPSSLRRPSLYFQPAHSSMPSDFLAYPPQNSLPPAVLFFSEAFSDAKFTKPGAVGLALPWPQFPHLHRGVGWRTHVPLRPAHLGTSSPWHNQCAPRAPRPRLRMLCPHHAPGPQAGQGRLGCRLTDPGSLRLPL